MSALSPLVARLGVILLALVAATTAHATERLALVIGIDQYENITDLERAGSDATAMADALEDWGFTVTLHTGITEQEFIGALTEFSIDIQPGDDVVFFFRP